MKSPIFIVGPHRSGSTLWHNLIAMCPGIMRLTDPGFLNRRKRNDFRYFLKTQAGDLSNDSNVDAMVELCFAKKQVPGLEATFWRFEHIDAAEKPEMRREISRRIKKSDRSLQSIARILIEELTRFSNCDRPCVKFPVDIWHIPELVTMFPDAKIVHITRDPRAMAMSKSNDPSGTALRVSMHPSLAWLIRKAMVFFVIAQYRWTARVHSRLKHHSNYRLFRYEDLLVEPKRVLSELCAFIECEFREEMLDPDKSEHEHQPSSLTGKRRKAFDPEAAVRWQTRISPMDNRIITALTSGSMKRMDYHPKAHPIFAIRIQSGSPTVSL